MDNTPLCEKFSMEFSGLPDKKFVTEFHSELYKLTGSRLMNPVKHNEHEHELRKLFTEILIYIAFCSRNDIVHNLQMVVSDFVQEKAVSLYATKASESCILCYVLGECVDDGDVATKTRAAARASYWQNVLSGPIAAGAAGSGADDAAIAATRAARASFWQNIFPGYIISGAGAARAISQE